MAPRLVLPEGCFSQRVAGPEFAVRRRAAPFPAVPQASEQVQSPTATAMPRVRPRSTGRPPTPAEGTSPRSSPPGYVAWAFSQRVACLEFAARRRKAPRGVCSSAIRCRGPRKTELPKLHSARPRATGRPPTSAEALRRVVPREGLSRGAPNSPRGAVRRRARCVPAPFGGVDPRKPVLPVKQVDKC